MNNQNNIFSNNQNMGLFNGLSNLSPNKNTSIVNSVNSMQKSNLEGMGFGQTSNQNIPFGQQPGQMNTTNQLGNNLFQNTIPKPVAQTQPGLLPNTNPQGSFGIQQGQLNQPTGFGLQTQSFGNQNQSTFGLQTNQTGFGQQPQQIQPNQIQTGLNQFGTQQPQLNPNQNAFGQSGFGNLMTNQQKPLVTTPIQQGSSLFQSNPTQNPMQQTVFGQQNTSNLFNPQINQQNSIQQTNTLGFGTMGTQNTQLQPPMGTQLLSQSNFQGPQTSFGQQPQIFGQNIGNVSTQQQINYNKTSEQIVLPPNTMTKKGQIVNSITYLPEMNGINLALIRLNDYKALKNNQIQNPQLKDSFIKYLQSVGNQKVLCQVSQSLPMTNQFGQSIQSGFQNQQNQPFQLGSTSLQGTSLFNTQSNPQQTTFNTQQQQPNQQFNSFGQTNIQNTNTLGQQQLGQTLFGQQQPQQQNLTGTSQGLFGQQTQLGQQKLNLPLGQPNQPQGTQLFSNIGQPQAQAQTSQLGTQGGLFGNQQTQLTNTTGGLFATQQQTQNPSQPLQTQGGLFGGQTGQGLQPQQQQQSSGLFGGIQQKPLSLGGVTDQTQQVQPTNLFGNTSTQTTQQTGLFGQTTQQQGSSLFGNTQTQNQQPTGGLFSSTTQTQQPSQGLFGQTSNQGGLFGNQQTQQQQSQSLFGSSLGQNQQSQSGLFGQNQQSDNTQGGLFKTFQPQQTQLQQTNLFQENLGQNQSVGQSQVQYMQNGTNPYLMFYIPIQGQEFNQLAQSLLNREMTSINLKQQTQQEYDQRENISLISMPDRLELMMRNKAYDNYDIFADQSQINYSKGKRFKFNNKERKNKFIKNQNQGQSLVVPNNNKEFMNLRIQVTLSNQSKKDTTVKVTDKTIIAEILHDLINKKIISKSDAQDCTISIGKQTLSKFNYIEDYPEIQHLSVIQVTLTQINILDQILAPKEMIPKNYHQFEIKPSISELSKMTENQLAKVNNFSIENSFGKIEFQNPVDLREVDLNQDVQINQKKISIYSQYSINDPQKPQSGQKLNQPAYLYFYNIMNKKGTSNVQFINKLKTYVKGLRAHFVHYDFETKTLKIKVDEFQIRLQNYNFFK